MSTTDYRIGDAEREQAVSSLGEHYLAGRLTKEEYDERADAAWTAKTASALAPLFRDLPPLHRQAVSSMPSSTRSPSALRPRRSARRRPMFPVFPVVALFVFLLVVTPLHMPWWAWLVFLWLWFSGGLAFLSRGFRHRWGPR